MLVEMETVSNVSPTAGRDLSVEGEDTLLTVILKAAGEDTVPCVNCKEPLEAGHCRVPTLP